MRAVCKVVLKVVLDMFSLFKALVVVLKACETLPRPSIIPIFPFEKAFNKRIGIL